MGKTEEETTVWRRIAGPRRRKRIHMIFPQLHDLLPHLHTDRILFSTTARGGRRKEEKSLLGIERSIALPTPWNIQLFQVLLFHFRFEWLPWLLFKCLPSLLGKYLLEINLPVVKLFKITRLIKWSKLSSSFNYSQITLTPWLMDTVMSSDAFSNKLTGARKYCSADHLAVGRWLVNNTEKWSR